MDDLQDIVKDFLVESYENLDQLDRDLVLLEQDPASAEELSSVFRTIHTIKGTCGFLGFGKLEGVAHVGENLLSKLRDGELALRPAITTGLLSLVDAIREILANIETLGAEGEADYTDLLHKLTRLQGEALAPEPPAAEQSAESTDSSDFEDASCLSARESDTSSAEGRSAGAAESTVRVDVELLDTLMNRVGELVLARNQIVQSTSTLCDPALVGASQRLNLITTELQEAVMKTRMQPIATVWSKFPRVVRDLAMQCGKQVRFELEGRETELDKTIIESIKDPLTHLVRNAIDHGIEPASVRQKAGKPAEGRLLLRAYHKGGQVHIEISDDGGGLDLARVRRKAIERGLVTADQAQRMSDHDAALLIFSAGFSTADTITHISGRGVGMDVVKTNIERIGGTVDIESRLGHGATVKLKIPLTLAIIPALIVTCAGDRFVVPQASIVELVRLEGEKARRSIERFHGASVYRLRGELLPIVDLRHELELDEVGRPTEVLHLVVLKADDRAFGLVVDSINDTEEIVVKPLSQQLKGIGAFSGATIMGDGRVALILDVVGLARQAGVVSESRDRTRIEPAIQPAERVPALQTVLIVQVGDRRLALPITGVARLEEISRSSIEQASGREVVQYRGQILPLFKLGALLGVAPSETTDRPLHVVVFHDERRSIGLVVDRIVDIVHTAIETTQRLAADDLVSAAVIGQRVTDILNTPVLMRRIESGGFEPQTLIQEACA